ncbi:SCO family protein [Bradyrhizobium sp. 45]|uniref:SCO family protein n=1 Tax=Bradyrhizobium sp. 45 TaxID=1043587 RepID=UPI001FFB7352|nr:SCO family protein [Bradyrhizobium sp. 45]
MRADPVIQADAPRLDGSLTEQTFAALVDQLRPRGRESAPDLVSLLSVSHAVFRGRSASSVVRMRAYAMAALHDTGLPDQAVPYIVEVLETSFHSDLVAAAARAVRGMATPDARLADYLIRSIYNVWQNDQPVTFETYDVKWPLTGFSTALLEVLDTLAWLGPQARHVIPELDTLLSTFSKRFSPRVRAGIERCIETLRSSAADSPKACCCGSAPLIDSGAVTSGKDLDIESIELEDQDGRRLAWYQFFKGKPSILAFFYTTCMNPRKCALTVYNLVSIHQRLSDAGLDDQVRIAAITYDPQRDTPAVLRQYGESKGVRFGADCKMMRVSNQFDRVIEAFELGVNYIGNQVNDHRVELYSLDCDGKITHTFLRLQADPERVITELARVRELRRSNGPATTSDASHAKALRCRAEQAAIPGDDHLLPDAADIGSFTARDCSVPK